LVRQLLTESVVLALLGGIAGVAVAYGGIELLTAFKPPNLHQVEASLDAVVLAFTLSVSLLAGLVVGLAPAVKTSRPDVNLTLKG
jgi:ABC-type antimicrobial peptide transport system permease subunit